jgi:cation diffusion facilitator CzcD-associated flavoprotein CzcO
MGTFHVTVFEALDRIGGLWPVSEKDDGMVNPDMCTNQSKHTVSFSDLAWPESAPAFPKAWQVGQYLERYVKTYPGYEIRKNCKVVKADLRDGKWHVRTQDRSSSETVEHEFDHLIVSTGFFGKPKVPKILGGSRAPVWHSSQVRDVKDLLTDGGKSSPSPRRNIVVVGGQMSGIEIAAAIALQLSSAETTPGECEIPNASEYYITHIIQNPIWVMTLFYPKDPVLDVPGPEGQTTKVKLHTSISSTARI